MFISIKSNHSTSFPCSCCSSCSVNIWLYIFWRLCLYY